MAIQPAFPTIRLQFDGGLADEHLIDMRELGKSLDGAGKILNAAAELLVTGENSKPRAQTRIKFHIRPVQHGCVPIDAVPLWVTVGFQFIQEVTAALGAEAIMQMTSMTTLLSAGNITEADKHHARLMEIIKQIQSDNYAVQQLHLAARERSEERYHELVRELAEANKRAAVDMVYPIGRSVNTVRVGQGAAGVTVDKPMAERIRANAGVEIGDLAQYRIVLDGFFATSKTCKFYFAEDIEQQNLFSGDILDPASEQFPNIYTTSIRQGVLAVTAKPALQDGEIVRLSIMDAKRAD